MEIILHGCYIFEKAIEKLFFQVWHFQKKWSVLPCLMNNNNNNNTNKKLVKKYKWFQAILWSVWMTVEHFWIQSGKHSRWQVERGTWYFKCPPQSTVVIFMYIHINIYKYKPIYTNIPAKLKDIPNFCYVSKVWILLNTPKYSLLIL